MREVVVSFWGDLEETASITFSITRSLRKLPDNSGYDSRCVANAESDPEKAERHLRLSLGLLYFATLRACEASRKLTYT